MSRPETINIVVEGPLDAAVLRRLLPKRITERCDFVVGGGKSSAVSTARTILTVSRDPVALIIDADTINQREIEAQRTSIRELLQSAAPGRTSALFLAVPSLEAIADDPTPVNQKPLVKELTQFINSVLPPRINVSGGQPLEFAANGNPVQGTIVASQQAVGPWASVIVETETAIPQNAQLTIPDLPETGGCGLAQPVSHNGHVRVLLNIGYSYIDLSTVGK